MDAKPRIPIGGLFHSHKIQYSKETQNLLHCLIEESKLSILQRQALKDKIQKGESLPVPQRSQSGRSHSAGLQKGEVLVPPALPRRRSHQSIIRSGAYQRETFDPPFNSSMKDREVEKQKLQSLMSYGKEVAPDNLERKKTSLMRSRIERQHHEEGDLFDHLLEEIRERLEWLEEMTSLGEGDTYRPVIEQEVAARLRRLSTIDNSKFIQLGIDLDQVCKKKSCSTKSASLPNNIFPNQ